jgi:hypothetical protein
MANKTDIVQTLKKKNNIYISFEASGLCGEIALADILQPSLVVIIQKKISFPSHINPPHISDTLNLFITLQLNIYGTGAD